MAESFEAQVNRLVRKTKRNMSALVRASVQDVVDMAQTPVAKGGRMRIDTGFLRLSGKMSLTGMPTGPVRGEKGGSYSSGDSNATVVASLGAWQIGVTIYFGWTAEYARYRELYDGFLATALQEWPRIVDRNINKINKR